jgi:hypothetical protein
MLIVTFARSATAIDEKFTKKVNRPILIAFVSLRPLFEKKGVVFICRIALQILVLVEKVIIS